ncbi:DUF4334 domain-containing protein [cf. Phormidesmis sp. LEGE 11477]|uniref:DUF4334 domain-containing protein n=1 Tax=cf. Phormidesmis sp. LEGE 11477 TaxID=1828680 RepID=UPI00188009B5|nr:DUF4334 domain-containing protein [cf. Phormidesmis sp. LEGE 11477]MBE9064234.1 DUF4334 domain-containing protein [cf. Phormidesmis sp. LEGE 11477]
MITEERTTLNQLRSPNNQAKTTTAAALALFDRLDPVEIDFMFGQWKGSGFHTGHPMDGLLEVANWYGKAFITPDCVHPLLFSDSKGDIFKIAANPQMMKLALRLPIPKNDATTSIFTLFNPLLKTENSQARLRMMEHRGKVSATMIYDYLPIHDVFRKVDENTLLGLMDYKESAEPFFFVLERER